MAEQKENSELGLLRVPVGPAGRRREPAGSGWLVFAGTMVLTAATADAVFGISAVTNADSFSDNDLVFGDLTTWGVFLTVAAIKAVVGLMIFARNPVGALLGILLAMLSGTLALLSILANPLLSILVITINLLVIFSLWAYGLRS